MRVGLDLDGLLDERPDFFAFLTAALRAGEHFVAVLTYRDPGRRTHTEVQLAGWGIGYDELHFARSLSDKGRLCRELGIDLYFDDQDECVVGVDERTTVFKVRNGGNFDFGERKWVSTAKMTRLLCATSRQKAGSGGPLAPADSAGGEPRSRPRPPYRDSLREGRAVVERVLIQKKNGEFATVNAWVAWAGFDRKAYPVSFFEWPDLRDGRVGVTPDTLVVGGVATVLHALRRLGVAPPTIDYPDALRPYLGRAVRPATLAEVRGRFAGDAPAPLFVKPREAHKAFTGSVFAAFRDLIPTAHLPDDLAVWVSDPVEFASEWRYFVRRHEVVGVGHYRGDPFAHPDPAVVKSAVADYRPEAPAAYGIDFGVAADGRTLLVEVNDGSSLGHVGLRPVPYADMLEDRWVELVAGRRSTAPGAGGPEEPS
jgi:hypothetical protein